jgi:RimJ/RimL family protein N-acetyltransferase
MTAVPLQERQVADLDYLNLVTLLLQRARQEDPNAGVWEAADLQWWWRRDQHPDPANQTFWLDGDVPSAAVIFMNWGNRWGCDVITTGVGEELVWTRAFERIGALSDKPVELTICEDDVAGIERAMSAGFEATDEVAVPTWMPAAERPKPTPLPPGFELIARSDDPKRPHPMIGRNGEHVADRLRECSLYRSELDLAVYAVNGDVAAYGLFWADLVTGVGLVEPMRTEDRYQGIGLARHVLTTGVERLAAHGCSRMKVSYMTNNEASRRLYLGSGFRASSSDRTYRRR